MNNVKSYTDKQLLDRVKQIGGYTTKGKYLLIGVQSNEDAFDKFDDKFYLFDGDTFVMVLSGTTNAGRTALKLFDRYGLKGAAVWRTNQFIKDCFVRGFHKRKMRALRANADIEFYRDYDRDDRADQTGTLYKKNIWANFHGVDYDEDSNVIRNDIGGWSFACQVANNMAKYRKLIKLVWDRNKPVDYCLLDEF